MTKIVKDSTVDLQTLCSQVSENKSEEVENIGNLALEALKLLEDSNNAKLTDYNIEPLEKELAEQAVTGFLYYICFVIQAIAYVFGQNLSLGVKEADALFKIQVAKQQEEDRLKEIVACIKSEQPELSPEPNLTVDSIPSKVNIESDPLLLSLSNDGVYLDESILEEMNKNFSGEDRAVQQFLLPNLERFIINKGSKSLSTEFNTFRQGFELLSVEEKKDQWESIHAQLKEIVAKQPSRQEAIESYAQTQLTQLIIDWARPFSITIDDRTYSSETRQGDIEEIIRDPEQKKIYKEQLTNALEQIMQEPSSAQGDMSIESRWNDIRVNSGKDLQILGDALLEGIKILDGKEEGSNRGMACIILFKVAGELTPSKEVSAAEKKARLYSILHQGIIGACTSMLNGMGMKIKSDRAQNITLTKQGEVEASLQGISILSNYAEALLSITGGEEFINLLEEKEQAFAKRGLQESDAKPGGSLVLGTCDQQISLNIFAPGLEIDYTDKKANPNFMKT